MVQSLKSQSSIGVQATQVASCVERKSMDGNHPRGLLQQIAYVDDVTLAHTEGYPSGLRGWFAKSLVWGDLEREFESPLLRQFKERPFGRF